MKSKSALLLIISCFVIFGFFALPAEAGLMDFFREMFSVQTPTGYATGDAYVKVYDPISIGNTYVNLKGEVLNDQGTTCIAHFEIRKEGTEEWLSYSAGRGLTNGDIFTRKIGNLRSGTRYEYRIDLECGTHSSSSSIKTFTTKGSLTITHSVCKYGYCKEVDGAGTDQCSTNSDCRHTECIRGKYCVTKRTPGVDQCKINADCNPNLASHTVCSDDKCVRVDGAGTDQCEDDNDCALNVCIDTDGGINYYKRGSAGIKYSDGSLDKKYDFCYTSKILKERYCKSDESTGTITYTCPNGCENGACINISNQTHTICSNKLCIEVTGAGTDECRKDSDCIQENTTNCPQYYTCPDGTQVPWCYLVSTSSNNGGSAGCVCITSPETQCPTNTTTTCTDTDGGINYYEKGRIIGEMISPEILNEDSCLGNTNTLREVYCNNESKGVPILYDCPYGCENGACINATSTEICDNNIDDDGDGKIDCLDSDCANIRPATLYCDSRNCEEEYCNPSTYDWECRSICQEGYTCQNGACRYSSNIDLSIYPEPFIINGVWNTLIVVGAQAPPSDVATAIDISSKLSEYATSPSNNGKISSNTNSSAGEGVTVNTVSGVDIAKLDTEITDKTSKPLILVGAPDGNRLVARLIGLDYPTSCEDAHSTFNHYPMCGRPGEGIIEIYKNAFGGNNVALLVTGRTEEDRRRAGKVLENFEYYEQHNLTGSCVTVTGDLNNPIVKPCIQENTTNCPQYYRCPGGTQVPWCYSNTPLRVALQFGETRKITIGDLEDSITLSGINSNGNTATITINGKTDTIDEGATKIIGGVNVYAKTINYYGLDEYPGDIQLDIISNVNNDTCVCLFSPETQCPIPINTTTCTDTDGGMNPSEYGEVFVFGGEVNHTYNDTCVTPELLEEKYCNGNLPDTHYWGCKEPYICIDGACIEGTDVLIKDNIGQLNYLDYEQEFQDNCDILKGHIKCISGSDIYSATYSDNFIAYVEVVRDEIIPNSAFISAVKDLKNKEFNSAELEEVTHLNNNIFVIHNENSSDDRKIVLALWYNSNKLIIVGTTISPTYSDNKMDDIFEAYIHKYPSNLVFEDVPECNGCYYDGKCYNYEHRKIIDGVRSYCNYDGSFVAQKEENEQCMNNYECKGNFCVDGKCIEAGTLERIIAWFKQFFNF